MARPLDTQLLATFAQRIRDDNEPARVALAMARAVEIFLEEALEDEDPGPDEAATLGDWKVAQGNAQRLIDALVHLRRKR